VQQTEDDVEELVHVVVVVVVVAAAFDGLWLIDTVVGEFAAVEGWRGRARARHGEDFDKRSAVEVVCLNRGVELEEGLRGLKGSCDHCESEDRVKE
jgi:hypothetical protein